MVSQLGSQNSFTVTPTNIITHLNVLQTSDHLNILASDGAEQELDQKLKIVNKYIFFSI